MNEHPVATATANAREAWAEEIRQLAIAELRQAERRAAFRGRILRPVAANA
jgi:hypothetical protein